MDGKVKFGAVDCSAAGSKAACQVKDHPIRGYPTFYFFMNGNWADEYRGQRRANDFVNWLGRK
jgi:hypothetical protein